VNDVEVAVEVPSIRSETMSKPLFGVKVNVDEEPAITETTPLGEIAPLAPAEERMVKV